MKRTAAVLAGVVLSAVLGFALLSSHTVIALDFRAFYCAGTAMRAGEDPYKTQSLHACERDTGSEYVRRLHDVTLPAPQPPYDIAVFALLSRLTFTTAKAYWGAVLGLAIYVALAALIRLTGLSPPIVFAILATTLIGFGMALGQIVPVFMAALCLCALFLKEEKPAWAALAASLTLVEPHLGAPVCASLLIWQPPSRRALLASCAALIAIGIALGGWRENVEYLTTVLPLHALSELNSDGQLSLSVALRALGVSPDAALRAGTLSYVLATGFGLFAARAAADRFSNAAYVAAFPAAAAICGGSFVHPTDVVAAIPLALLFLSDSRADQRWLFVSGLVLLEVPWAAQTQNTAEMLGWLAFSALAAAYVVAACGRAHVALCALCAAVVFAALCELGMAYASAQHAASPRIADAAIDRSYPQAGWKDLVDRTIATGSVPAWLMRAPTWGGLVILMCAGTLVSFRFRALRTAGS